MLRGGKQSKGRRTQPPAPAQPPTARRAAVGAAGAPARRAHPPAAPTRPRARPRARPPAAPTRSPRPPSAPAVLGRRARRPVKAAQAAAARANVNLVGNRLPM
ncbi:hypothetical protein Raf01_45860 [Rugosimonospora africana]|uniref:Uncharacterized protein n=1 Tax=Rugosimonospora africana TaxID=556532 RepID=A0A8J3QT04_9ACTN|nr:hypothetical protein Raf01_45860 [Rugosimonospora africana]